MRRRVPKKTTDRARALRREPTEAELALWPLISRYRPKFTRQLSVHPFVLDLACRQAKLAVELDGSQHLEQIEYDDRRTSALARQGWTVLRFWNNDVLSDPDSVAVAILAAAAECLGGTHPQPLPSREGRVRRPRSRKPGSA